MAIPPNIQARLAQLKAEAAARAEMDRRRQLAAQNAEKLAQPQQKANGGLSGLLKGSKVKERLYHGTPKSFSKFKTKKGMIFLAHKPDFANDYAGGEYTIDVEKGSPNVMPVHVHVKNPWDYENPEHVEALHAGLSAHPHIGPEFAPTKNRIASGDWTLMEDPAVQETIKKMGHDAFFLNEGGYRNLGMYNPRNIKSAIGNRGTYDRRTTDITKASGGSIPSHDVMRLAIGGQGPKNWLKGSVEQVIDPLTRTVLNDIGVENLRSRQGDEVADSYLKERPQHEALNNWVKGNLANYIRKQMGGHKDPVRDLAEQGILHFDPNTVPIIGGHETAHEHAESRRQMLGGQKMAKGPLAQAWEDAVDSRFEPHSIEDMLSMPEMYRDEIEPWMLKANPKTDVFEPYAFDELGFNHIVDILKEDLASGRIRPEQLNKVSMADAVRRTYEVDQANKKAQQQASLQATEGMPVHKDYGNGYKWIEIAPKKPDVNDPLPKGYQWLEPKNGLERLQGPSILNPERGRVYLGDTKQEALESAHKKDHNLSDRFEKPVKDALAYESDMMGHCVGGQKLPNGTRTGGYTDDVMRGDKRIFSLRDEKNEPHVTIEVRPPKELSPGHWLNTLPEQEQQAVIDLTGAPGKHPAYKEWLANQPQSIAQIKGKGNAKPKKDYIPFVQDFVRSGNWSDIGDFKNTDLVKHEGKLLTKDEHADWLLNQLKPDQNMADGGEVNAEDVFMAGGGSVSPESCFFPNTKE